MNVNKWLAENTERLENKTNWIFYLEKIFGFWYNTR